jgi:predicted amidohydrolase
VAAAVQRTPSIPFDKQKTIDMTCEIIAEAAGEDAKLVVFPECFVPMYPNWSIDLQEPNDWASNLREFTRNSVTVPGPEVERVANAAREAGVYVVLGLNETVKSYDGALFNSLVFIDSSGRLVGHHRKLFPSNREKVFHARGDASGLRVYDTRIGRVGGLICYEHLQPLLKYSLIGQGEQIHCALWPGWPEHPGGRSNRHVVDVASRAHALEGQCFVVASSLYVSKEKASEAGLGNASWDFFGGSGIINPSGEYVVGPLYDTEGIVYGEIYLSETPLRKAAIDTTGRDSAWETISMNVNRSPRMPIHYNDGTSDPHGGRECLDERDSLEYAHLDPSFTGETAETNNPRD